MKHIEYSDHARERMEHRYIPREYVRQAIAGPHKLIKIDNRKKRIVAKLRDKDLVVVYVETSRKFIVVTAFWKD